VIQRILGRSDPSAENFGNKPKRMSKLAKQFNLGIERYSGNRVAQATLNETVDSLNF
jgi:hypothetical protein